MAQSNKPISTNIPHLTFAKKSFPDIEKILSNQFQQEIKTDSNRNRFNQVNEILLKLIIESPHHSFLLPEIVDFIDRVNTKKLLNQSYHISLFEFWLNFFSSLPEHENYLVRAKIMGKNIPREDYQAFFPVGMNVTYPGSHFVSAHLSPDVDTMIASFWGWVDAFATRVGTGLHYWNLPGGPPANPVTEVFKELFGQSVFSSLARTTETLTLRAFDLVTPRGDLKRLDLDSFRIVSLNSELEEIRKKMGNHDYLMVIFSEKETLEEQLPVGVIKETDLRKSQLGTVSFRDFCNEEEVKMAPYLKPISVIDHHKASLKTPTPPFALISDAQSCNVMVAEQAFRLNDPYSLGGMTLEIIENEITTLVKEPLTLSSSRILQRLLQRKIASESSSSHVIHPERELAEYVFFLYAIFDDTDLLTKMSKRDVLCVVALINRIMSLLSKKELEVVNLDPISQDQYFIKNASKHILQKEVVYSLYRSIYESKENEFEGYLQLKNKDDYYNLFIDTKEQNGCCRISQTKLFSTNYTSYLANRTKLLEYWLKQSQEVNEECTTIDFYLQMLSTIASAEDVYKDQAGQYTHSDEIWIWLPNTQTARIHLESFLNGFQHHPKIQKNQMTVILPTNADELAQLFSQNFHHFPIIKDDEAAAGLPIIILRFKAGTVNSRKSMITPFLPRVIE